MLQTYSSKKWGIQSSYFSPASLLKRSVNELLYFMLETRKIFLQKWLFQPLPTHMQTHPLFSFLLKLLPGSGHLWKTALALRVRAAQQALALVAASSHNPRVSGASPATPGTPTANNCGMPGSLALCFPRLRRDRRSLFPAYTLARCVHSSSFSV